MKSSIFLLLLCVSIALHAGAQQVVPVKFRYEAKELEARQYEVRITAELGKGWHIYSQQFRGSAMGTATFISFNKNPLIEIIGTPQEINAEGKVASSSSFHVNKVDFVQIVKLKGKASTTLNGSIFYQVCTDVACLPPDKQTFSIKLPPVSKQ